jgi:thiamine pyrophosphokinase
LNALILRFRRTFYLIMTRILIFANGELPSLEAARGLVHADDLLIAADGGTRHILALGLTPHSIVGDLDSISFDLQPLVDKGAQVVRFPGDKDETDLELTISHALTFHPDQVVIVAALGNRLDQTLANIGLISDMRLSSLDVRIDDGVEDALFCRDQVQVHGRSGDLVSLLPWQGEVAGVRTEGLKWPLKSETLYPQKTRGISNEMLGAEATVTIDSGLLLVVHRRQS